MNMKASVPTSGPAVPPDFAAIQSLFQEFVIPTYGRFDVVFTRGEGAWLWDTVGRRYLDLGAGIAVCCLGHAHPELAETLAAQARQLIHVSNLYYHELQGRLASELVGLIGPGKVFFCNSGAEADEGLFKLARKFGHGEGRFEILTCANSFHGRTMAGIAATGQEKVRKGFEPLTPGFRQVSFNDVDAMREAISPATAAILIEGIQGEGGITPATSEYLLGLRQLCDEQNLLLLMDCVQCGHYRTGRFQSFQRILEGVPGGDEFLPDAISIAKSLGGGFPMGAFWVRREYSDLLGPGSHGTTFGGTPLACSVALQILEIAQRDHLADNARRIGVFLRGELERLIGTYPLILRDVRGLGLMLGLELVAESPVFRRSPKAPSLQCVQLLNEAGLLVIPAGNAVLRLLPALNISDSEAGEGIRILESVFRGLQERNSVPG